ENGSHGEPDDDGDRRCFGERLPRRVGPSSAATGQHREAVGDHQADDRHRRQRRVPSVKRALALSSLLCSLLLVNVARADAAADALEAKERYDRGVDLYAQGDYGGALAE